MLEILDYNPNWKVDFENIKAKILEVSKPTIICVDHIGSTSIPNMPAKDIIDIQIGVRNFDVIESLRTAYESIGFNFIPEFNQDHVPFHEFDYLEHGWEKRFFTSQPHTRACNIHVRVVNSENWKFALLFRDFLIADHHAAKAYAQIKKRLAEAFPEDKKSYTLIKDPACDLIFLLAKQWAKIRKIAAK